MSAGIAAKGVIMGKFKTITVSLPVSYAEQLNEKPSATITRNCCVVNQLSDYSIVECRGLFTPKEWSFFAKNITVKYSDFFSKKVLYDDLLLKINTNTKLVSYLEMLEKINKLTEMQVYGIHQRVAQIRKNKFKNFEIWKNW